MGRTLKPNLLGGLLKVGLGGTYLQSQHVEAESGGSYVQGQCVIYSESLSLNKTEQGDQNKNSAA